MHKFESHRPPAMNQVPVSIKLRVESGCFHREHSPHAYEIIDRHLSAISPDNLEFAIEEHESGPEILVYLAVTTAGLTLAKSVIDLIIAIIKARTESIKKGDHPSAPLELIVRHVQKDGEFREEKILRIAHDDLPDKKALEHALRQAITKFIPKKDG
jgi:hypothetical protein